MEGEKCLPSNVEFYPQCEVYQGKYWQNVRKRKKVVAWDLTTKRQKS